MLARRSRFPDFEVNVRRASGGWTAALAWASLLVPAFASAPARAQEIPANYEQGLFNVVIPDLASRSIPVLLAPDGTLLFPLLEVLRGAGVPYEGDAGGYTLSLLDDALRESVVRVDTVSRTISHGDTLETADSTEMVRAEGDVYLTAALLATLLRADVASEFATLELRVMPRVPFPAQLSQDNERRRQLAMIRAGMAAGPPLPPTGLRSHSGAGVLHYSLSSATPDTRTATVLTTEAGFALFGGLGAVGYTFSDADVVIDPRLTLRYERFIPEQRWISFVRAGDVIAEGAFFRSIRGLTVTNRPLRREGLFQDIVIDPEVPPGYEVEVYQGGQLIAFSDRATQGPISVPLSYGRTDLEVRMIAPSGEVVSTGLLYGVPQSQLPEDALEYAAGAGECHVLDCTLFYAGADYGVRRWLTVGAGYEAEHDTLGFTHLPFGRMSVAPAGGWLGDLRVVGDRQASAAMQYNGLGALTGSLGIDVRSAEVPRATLLPQTRTRWDTRAEAGYRGHRVLARLGGMESEGIDRWGAGYIASIPRGVLITQLEAFDERAAELSLTTFRLLRARVFGGTMTGSGRLSTTRHGVRAVELGTSASWGNSLFGNLALGWDRDADFNVTLSFSRILPIGQLAGVAAASRDASRATVRADGALAIDPFSAVEPAAYTGIGFAGVDAFIYRDANGNGEFDEGDRVAPGVAVQAGEYTATSDSSGHARIWGLLPWEKTLVRASPDWFEPQWAPATAERVIRPVAHIFNPIAVPLVATREFIAYIVPGTDVRTTAGIGYRLISERSGRVWEGLTLSDGSIYVGGVPVGDYRLELDADALAFLMVAAPAPIRFTIGGTDADEFVFELPPIELNRAP